ncbi:MAG: DUF1573 domain-containing protein [Polaribacter sp.]|nr:DUF1573 domain-containing protein [Polaribacter sp.]
MKNIFLFISVCFLTTSLFSQEKKEIEAEFKFEEEIIDYGKIAQNSERVRVFEFTNIGATPLIITNVRSSCGCTIPKKPTEPIMPNKKGTIEVSYDTSRLGGFSKIITIFSNAKNKRKTIRIKGYITKKKSVIVKKKSMLSKQ